MQGDIEVIQERIQRESAFMDLVQPFLRGRGYVGRIIDSVEVP
ncbi:MAG TPA: hypothetical protein VGA70_13605 [Longimicrobiales bacterium]|jgi:hypothetical protein